MQIRTSLWGESQREEAAAGKTLSPPGLVPGLWRWREGASLAEGVVIGGGLVICCFMEDFELYGTHDGGPGWLLVDGVIRSQEPL